MDSAKTNLFLLQWRKKTIYTFLGDIMIRYPNILYPLHFDRALQKDLSNDDCFIHMLFLFIYFLEILLDVFLFDYGIFRQVSYILDRWFK